MTRRSLAVMKGLAILFMVFHHLYYSPKTYETYALTGFIINQDVTRILANEMKVCVNLFAMLSGYGWYLKTMRIEATNRSERARNHLLSMVKGYFHLTGDTLFLIILLTAVSVCFGLPKTPESVWGNHVMKGVLVNGLGLAGFFRMKWFVSSWWYLHVAIQFILLSPLLCYMTRKTGMPFLIVMTIMPYLLGVNLSNDSLWRYLPSFLAGMLLADRKTTESLQAWIKGDALHRRKLLKKILVLTMCLLAIGSMYYLKQAAGLKNHIIHTVQAVLIVLLSASVLAEVRFLSDALALLGRHSKYIWLIHAFIYGQIMGKALFEIGNIWIIFLIVVAFSLVFAVILKGIFQGILAVEKRLIPSRH